MRRVFSLSITVCILILFSIQMVDAADTYYWYDNNIYHQLYSQFNLSENKLSLPDAGNTKIKSFSLEAQQELIDIASLYGNRTSDLPGLKLDNTVDLSKSRPVNSDLQNDENSFNLNLSPDVLLNAKFDRNSKDRETTKETNLSLEYHLNNKTLIRAEYDMASREWWDTEKQLTLNENDSNSSSNSNSELPKIDNYTGDNTAADGSDQIDNSEEKDISLHKVITKPVYKEEKTEKGRVGISYKTSDKITISADYVDDDFNSVKDFSTVLGVKYHVDRGELWYEYQVDHGDESKQTATGLEYGLNELTTLNASYKLLDTNDLITNRLQKSIWDFGLDFSLSDFSSLSIGYQVKSNDDLNRDLDEKNKNEANIEAQLEIKF